MMQIVLECLVGWDLEKRRGKEGVLGVVEAFAKADEEQGRKTLHSHWLIWVRNLGKLQSLLYSSDEDIAKEAREEFIKYIDKVMSASYGDKFEVSPRCCPNESFVDRENQIFRDARHKEHFYDVNGEIIKCSGCGKAVTTAKLVNYSLQVRQDAMEDSNVDLPISERRRDIAAYRYLRY